MFVAIHVDDNEAGRTEVPLIYLSDDNAFSRLYYLEATESKRNLKRLSIAFLLFKEKSPTNNDDMEPPPYVSQEMKDMKQQGGGGMESSQKYTMLFINKGNDFTDKSYLI